MCNVRLIASASQERRKGGNEETAMLEASALTELEMTGSAASSAGMAGVCVRKITTLSNDSIEARGQDD